MQEIIRKKNGKTDMIASHTPVEIAHANQINMVKLSSTGT
jgi:hypothetical protein